MALKLSNSMKSFNKWQLLLRPYQHWNDSVGAIDTRAEYPQGPAKAPPAVFVGDVATPDAFWHGERLGEAFGNYVTLLTNGSGSIVWQWKMTTHIWIACTGCTLWTRGFQPRLVDAYCCELRLPSTRPIGLPATVLYQSRRICRVHSESLSGWDKSYQHGRTRVARAIWSGNCPNELRRRHPRFTKGEYYAGYWIRKSSVFIADLDGSLLEIQESKLSNRVILEECVSRSKRWARMFLISLGSGHLGTFDPIFANIS